DDVEAVRRYVEDVLLEAGYRVLAADSGEEALELARGERIDLLVSDVVMPGLSRPALAERLEAERPGLHGLFASGYPDEDTGGHELILKPFDAETLTHRIRALLDGD